MTDTRILLAMNIAIIVPLVLAIINFFWPNVFKRRKK